MLGSRMYVVSLAGVLKHFSPTKLRFVFWDVLPCKIIVDRRFRGTCCLHHQGDENVKSRI